MAKTSTYAQGVHALQNGCKAAANSVHPQCTLDDGNKIYRPLTFKENIGARVHDYESNKDSEERLRLFQRWNNSCTAIAYQKGTAKFKVVPISQELIFIPEDFNQSYMKIKYDDIEEPELEQYTAIYNEALTPAQVETHPAWLAAVEGDVHLLKTYRDIVVAERKTKTAMAFGIQTEISEDYLRTLFVSDLDSNSNAGGLDLKNYGGSFLRVVPVVSAGGKL
ncbi:MAG: hypothetical protein AABX31_04255 [Nanoarchaeota archaeon]